MSPIRVQAIVLGLAFILAGCGSTPVEPTGAVGPAPKTYPPPAGSWTVTMTVTESSGSGCRHPAPVGASVTQLYTLEGEGTSTITFVGPNVESTSYTVAVTGLSFQSAPVTFDSGVSFCTFVYSSRFKGTFSADHNAFTATQSDTYTTGAGEVESETWTWSGKRN